MSTPENTTRPLDVHEQTALGLIVFFLGFVVMMSTAAITDSYYGDSVAIICTFLTLIPTFAAMYGITRIRVPLDNTGP